MSPHNWLSQMDTCQNLIHILLDGQGIINLLKIKNIEISLNATCHHIINLHQSKCVIMGSPCTII